MLRGRVSVPPPALGSPVVTVCVCVPVAAIRDELVVAVPEVVWNVAVAPAPLAIVALWLCAPSAEVVPVCVWFSIAAVWALPIARLASMPRLSSHERTNSPRRSGRLKVVDPSPVPNRVPIAEKREAYVVRETACPFAFSHPEGAEVMAKCITAPAGSSAPIAVCQ